MNFSQIMLICDAEVQLQPHLADHNDSAFLFDEDSNTIKLELGRIWAYSCKHPSCPYYDKTWMLQSNFLNHLKDLTIHWENETIKSHAEQRQCVQKWRYETSLEEPKRLSPLFKPNHKVWHYRYRSADGKMVSASHDRVWSGADNLLQRSGQGTSAEIATLKNIQFARAQHDSTTLNELKKDDMHSTIKEWGAAEG